MCYKGKLKLRDRSTLNEAEYLLLYVSLGCSLGFGWYNLFPQFVIARNWNAWGVLLSMVVVGIIGNAMTFTWNRTISGMVSDVLIGLCGYMVFVIGKYNSVILWIMANIWLLVTLIQVVPILCQELNGWSRPGRIMWLRFIRSAAVARTNLGVICGIALVVLPLSVRLSQTSLLEVASVYDDSYSMSANIDTIKLIRDDETFQTLVYEEKCEVVETVIRCVIKYLGIAGVDVKITELTDDCTLGYYDYNSDLITINAAILEKNVSAETVLENILHECRHCYQYRMMELYRAATTEQRALLVFKENDVESWIENVYEYVDAGETTEEYYEYISQPVEEDARSWAKEQYEVFCDEIDELTGAHKRLVD